MRAKGQLRIHAETLFICGGAVQTPALLRRSGMTRNIGNSLRLHPTIKVVAKFPEAVNSAQMGVPVHQVKEFAPRYSFGCSISNPPYLALALLEHPEAAREGFADWDATGDVLRDDHGRRAGDRAGGAGVSGRAGAIQADGKGPARPGGGIEEIVRGVVWAERRRCIRASRRARS